MNSNISTFLNEEKICTLSYVDVNKSKSVIVFFAFSETEKGLYFQTNPEKSWILSMQQNPRISGTVLRQGKNWFQQKGLNFEGILAPLEDSELNQAKKMLEKSLAITTFSSKPVYKIKLQRLSFTAFGLGIPKTYTWEEEGIFENTESKPEK